MDEFVPVAGIHETIWYVCWEGCCANNAVHGDLYDARNKLRVIALIISGLKSCGGGSNLECTL